MTPLVLMPRLYLPPSEFLVQPVLAYWHRPGPVAPVDPAETAVVARVPIADLADPANRVRCGTGASSAPAFEVAGMLVWGFTGRDRRRAAGPGRLDGARGSSRTRRTVDLSRR